MMQMRIILNASVSTVKRLRISLGTLVAVEATADSMSAAVAAVEAAFAAIAQVDHRMHPQTPESDLARINASPLHVPIKVHASIGELLNLARGINTLTDGVFDPCLPTQPGRLGDIDVLTDEDVLTDQAEVVCHATVALDFGGFAKGYAVDCAIEALKDSGCTAGLVNAGGDLRVFGPRTEPMFLRGPAGELTNIELADAALAVSDANSQQHRPPEHQGYYVRDHSEHRSHDDDLRLGHARAAHRSHDDDLRLSDARAAHRGQDTAAPALVASYAAVIANTAVIADALAKCVLLCPKPLADRALRAFGATQALAPVNDAHVLTNRPQTPTANQ
jgi:FAD:protein FMN transferase